jgi:tetratricopeptide (TPR) repeat protein
VDGLFFSGPAFESLDSSLGSTDMKVGDASLFQIIHGRENGAFRDERMVPAVKKSLGSAADSPAFLKGGLFFLKRGDLDQAYPWFQKVKKAEPHFVVKIAKLYTSQHRYEYAESIITKAMDHVPDSLELVMALAEVYFKDERYAEVTALLRGRIDPDDTNAVNLEALADAFYYHGISLLETGEIAEGIPSVAAALEKEPLDARYRLGGLYALARSEQWDQFLEAAERIVRQEGIEIDFEINDFADIGRLIFMVLRHLAGENRGDAVWICKKMLAYLIRTKIAEQGEIDRMQRIMEETDRMISGMGM